TLDDRCEGHEFGPSQPHVQKVVGFPPGGVGENSACPECAGSEFHAVRIYGAEFAFLEPARRSFDRRLIDAPDAGRASNLTVDSGREIPPEVKVAQILTLIEPASETVALQQPRERAADRQAVVAHRGKDKDLIEVELFSKQPIQFDVGKNTARQSEVPCLSPREQLPD